MPLQTRSAPAPVTTRRYPRAVFSVPLTLQRLSVDRMKKTHGISLDLAEGGLGALLDERLAVGEMVAIDLPLAGRVLNPIAIVRYASGMSAGFEFLGLTADERTDIVNAAGLN